MSLKVLTPMVPPSMTSTQRDAIPAGRRPKGAMIFNTTLNRVEVNLGTDAAPAWVSENGVFADQTLAAAAQFDIQNIPQTHAVLRIELYACTNTTANDVACFRPNADSSANHYSQRSWNSSGTNGGDQNTSESYNRMGWIPGSTTGGLGYNWIEIPNYTSSTQFKRFYGMYSMYDGANNIVAMIGGSYYPNTNPITRIWAFPAGGGNVFGVGSRMVVSLK